MYSANVGLANRALKNYNKAFEYLEAGLEIAKEHQFNSVIYAIYKDLSETYSELEYHERSHYYYERYAELKDSIKNISLKSVEMGRYRLRKKLGLNPNEEISVFLQQL